MKKNVLLNLFLLILAVNLSAADGVTQDIEKICSFTFPAVPHITDVQGMRNYVYETDSCSYLVQIKPITQGGVIRDSATLYAFYEGSVKGILRAARGTQIGTKPITISGLGGQELEYVRGDQGHQPVSVCSRILLINEHVIIYTFTAPYSRFISLKYAKDHFFESFLINKDKARSQIVKGSAATEVKPVAGDTAVTPTPIFDSVTAHQQPPVTIHTELVRSNTLRFIVSFAASIFLLALTLYALVKWRKRKAGNE